jgi:8-oxo-dGTP diphosphatase
VAVQLTSAAHLLLYDDTRLLMLRRHNTGWADGHWSVVAGHVEPNEPATATMAREAKEEAGIVIDPHDLHFVHVMHRQKADGTTKLDIFFRCTRWQGEVQNAEPHKCDALDWYYPDRLPERTVPYIRSALESIRDGQHFSEFGWIA